MIRHRAMREKGECCLLHEDTCCMWKLAVRPEAPRLTRLSESMAQNSASASVPESAGKKCAAKVLGEKCIRRGRTPRC